MNDHYVIDRPATPQPPTPGVCVWLTGRSGAGKSTVTNILVPALEAQGRVVTVLDSVPLLAKTSCERTSEGKLLRKALVASEIVRHGGIVVCVTVSARSSVRDRARRMVGADRFVEVFFDVPPELALSRRQARGSRTSLKKALKNTLRPAARRVSKRYRGDYEPPAAPEVTIDNIRQSPGEGADAILAELSKRGFLETAPSLLSR